MRIDTLLTPVKTLIRFGRLHTLVATSIQVGALYFFVARRAVMAGGEPPSLGALVAAWAACLAANVYVVGLNQLTDVAIDRVNKPELPLASRALSYRDGRRIVILAGALAVVLAAFQSVALFVTVTLTMLIGSAYSLPPRWKERPWLAALSIALTRGVIANVGLYAHFAGEGWWPIPADLGRAVIFFFGFGLVIALFKDVPDAAGDRQFGVGTFSVRWGRRRVFALGRWLLTGLFVLPIGGALARGEAGGAALAAAYGGLLLVFWLVSLRTDPTRPESMFRLYFVLWGVFYASYLLLPW